MTILIAIMLVVGLDLSPLWFFPIAIITMLKVIGVILTSLASTSI